ncbi:MAG: HTH domain-containing protein [Staphylococcus epidermidis]|nr:HTH domain-containing protein [Staphylococcus epidermidis]
MNKLERQNRIIQTIQSSDKITASQLAKQFNVSKRTILRDIDELEDQGVKVYARHGKLGGYQIKDAHAKITLSLTEQQLSALFLTLNESQSNSTLPYQNEIRAIIKQCLNLPQTRLRKLLDSNHVTLPQLFSDILIYCTERNVMLVDLNENNQIQAENVIFIGLICKNAVWHAVVFEIGRGYTRELSILDIQDISYSFEKTIQTQDISIENYRQFLAPSE